MCKKNMEVAKLVVFQFIAQCGSEYYTYRKERL